MLRDEIVYRPALVSDAGELAAFGSEAFVAAYGHALSPGNLALHVARTYSEERQQRELEDPDAWTIIADRDGDVVAAAYLRWAAPPANLAPELRWAEIGRFYLAKPYWRTGISSDLMVATLASIRERRGELVWLQAWEHAEVALRFYRKWGFLEVGETPFHLGSERQRDLILARSLRGSGN
jgi:diamine N-acetyltransferase